MVYAHFYKKKFIDRNLLIQGFLSGAPVLRGLRGASSMMGAEESSLLKEHKTLLAWGLLCFGGVAIYRVILLIVLNVGPAREAEA